MFGNYFVGLNFRQQIIVVSYFPFFCKLCLTAIIVGKYFEIIPKLMNFSSKGIPGTPQHTDSHPCIRPLVPALLGISVSAYTGPHDGPHYATHGCPSH